MINRLTLFFCFFKDGRRLDGNADMQCVSGAVQLPESAAMPAYILQGLYFRMRPNFFCDWQGIK
jgi:hypothetical protein